MLPDCDKKRCTNLLQLSPYRYKGPETYSASKAKNISNFYFTGPLNAIIRIGKILFVDEGLSLYQCNVCLLMTQLLTWMKCMKRG